MVFIFFANPISSSNVGHAAANPSCVMRPSNCTSRLHQLFELELADVVAEERERPFTRLLEPPSSETYSVTTSFIRILLRLSYSNFHRVWLYFPLRSPNATFGATSCTVATLPVSLDELPVRAPPISSRTASTKAPPALSSSASSRVASSPALDHDVPSRLPPIVPRCQHHVSSSRCSSPCAPASPWRNAAPRRT